MLQKRKLSKALVWLLQTWITISSYGRSNQMGQLQCTATMYHLRNYSEAGDWEHRLIIAVNHAANSFRSSVAQIRWGEGEGVAGR